MCELVWGVSGDCSVQVQRSSSAGLHLEIQIENEGGMQARQRRLTKGPSTTTIRTP